jgi:hypothetical protein
MRALQPSPAPSAREAIALFVYRIGRELRLLAARVCRDAAWLGIARHTRALTDRRAV